MKSENWRVAPLMLTVITYNLVLNLIRCDEVDERDSRHMQPGKLSFYHRTTPLCAEILRGLPALLNFSVLQAGSNLLNPLLKGWRETLRQSAASSIENWQGIFIAAG